MSYEELFEVGNSTAGAYVCQLTSTTEGLTLAPGGPVVAPAAREYAAPITQEVEASATKYLAAASSNKKTTFFEEAFHALQHLHNHPVIKTIESGQEVDAWEYDAKQALLKHSEKPGLSYEE